MTDPLLEVKDLHVGLPAGGGQMYPILQGVSFKIMPGEAFGLVGESGSGKSVTSLATMGLLKKPLRATGGEILFRGRDLLKLSKREMRKLRGDRVAMIFQEPMTALNPLVTVGRQIAEMFYLHQGKSWAEGEKLAIEALATHTLVLVVMRPSHASSDNPRIAAFFLTVPPKLRELAKAKWARRGDPGRNPGGVLRLQRRPPAREPVSEDA